MTNLLEKQVRFTMSDEYPKQFPLHRMHIHLQDGQNLTCHQFNHAPATNHHGQAKHFLSLQSTMQAVREALPLGLQSIQLSGQNSLWHPELDLIFDALESLELMIDIETSGVGLTPQRVNRLARLPQCSVTIAINGADAATHDSYSMPGSFEYATRAIKILASAGVPVHTVFSAHRRNSHQLASVVRLIEELGGASIRFNHTPPTARYSAKKNGNGNGHLKKYNSLNEEINLSQIDELQVEELIALGWRVERDLAYTTPLRLIFEQPPAFRGLHPKARIDGHGRCGILDSLSVTAAEEYTLCGLSHALPGLVLGKVGQDSLENIWANHSTLHLLREELPGKLEGVCDRCTMKYSCLGSCPVENFIRTGAFWGPGWFCEAAERVGLFPAGRLIENFW